MCAMLPHLVSVVTADDELVRNVVSTLVTEGDLVIVDQVDNLSEW